MNSVGKVVSVLVVTPIWYYLLYSILTKVGATELQMFLFWVYVPCHMLVFWVRETLVTTKALSQRD